MSEPLSERALARLLALAAEDDDDGAASMPALPARYEIVRELGRGGMGIVYEAIDHQLGRRCAVKTLGARAGADEEARRRFGREASAAARLRHPHIAAVYDATPDYISMQLVAGIPIDAVRRDERHLHVELVRDAARALQHAHEHGVVHRDVKPSNLLVEGRHVYVVDFGLAKAIAVDAAQSLPGVVLGTPAFMPPEQALGRTQAIDARSDVYGLGATLYQCLTGRPPFEAADLPTLLRCVVEDEPAPPRIEADLDRVVSKCLAKEPSRRYATAAELADDLERWLQHEPVQARGPSFAYRMRKRLQRQRPLWRAGAIAALAAGVLTALVLLPMALRASAARAAANEAVALADHATTVLQDAVVFTRLGDLASAHQVLDGGIASAREFLSRHEVPRARYLLSRLLRARGQTDLALEELERTLAQAPALVDARFERGLMLAALPQPTEAQRRAAIDDLTVGEREQPVLTSVDRLFGRAELLRLRGDQRAAIELLQEVLEYDTTHVAARVSLSRAALASGQADLGRYYAASAVDLQQGYGPVYLARERQTLPISILGLEGALVDFAPELRDGVDNALAMAHRGLVHLRRGLRLETEGRAGEALAAVQAAIEDHRATLYVHDDLAGARNNHAVCLLVAARMLAEAGDAAAAATARTSAEMELTRALAGTPSMPEAHFNLGVAARRAASLLRALGRFEAAVTRAAQARQEFESALHLAPVGWPHTQACRAWLDELDAMREPGR